MKERRPTASVLNRFRQDLLRRERSTPTIEKYLHDVRTFAVWLDGREVTPEAVLAWKRELVDQFKPGTVNGKLAAVNALFAFAGWPDCQARSLKVQRRAFRDNARELTKEEFTVWSRQLNASEKTASPSSSKQSARPVFASVK